VLFFRRMESNHRCSFQKHPPISSQRNRYYSHHHASYACSGHSFLWSRCCQRPYGLHHPSAPIGSDRLLHEPLGDHRGHPYADHPVLQYSSVRRGRVYQWFLPYHYGCIMGSFCWHLGFVGRWLRCLTACIGGCGGYPFLHSRRCNGGTVF
jgi:hypothetical protein